MSPTRFSLRPSPNARSVFQRAADRSLHPGLRHLAWDLGYGFNKKKAERNSVIVFALSFLAVAAIFALVWTGHAGYLQ